MSKTKAISQKSKKILDKLTEDLKVVGAHKKIEREPYMPLSLEIIDTYGRDQGFMLAICHYGEQNGDLMRDPEVCLIKAQDGNYYPYYFRNDYTGTEQQPVEFNLEDGTVQRYWKKQQADIAYFVNIWCKNLRDQGFIKALEFSHTRWTDKGFPVQSQEEKAFLEV